MKMTWLGTAAAEGWPAMFCRCPSCTESAKHGGKSIRSRSQSLVNDDLLIDFPADTYLHMMHGGLNLDAVTDVIITHAHEDHFYPEDLANRQSGYTRFRAPHAFNVYGNDAVCAAYERVASVIGNDEMPQVVPCTKFLSISRCVLRIIRCTPCLRIITRGRSAISISSVTNGTEKHCFMRTIPAI